MAKSVRGRAGGRQELAYTLAAFRGCGPIKPAEMRPIQPCQPKIGAVGVRGFGLDGLPCLSSERVGFVEHGRVRLPVLDQEQGSHRTGPKRRLRLGGGAAVPAAMLEPDPLQARVFAGSRFASGRM